MELDQKSKILSVVAHIGWLAGVGFILIPVAIMLLVRDDEFVTYHAKQAAASQIAMTLLGVLVWILCLLLVGFILLHVYLVVVFVWAVFSVYAAWKAWKGETCSYPIIGRFLN